MKFYFVFVATSEYSLVLAMFKLNVDVNVT